MYVEGEELCIHKSACESCGEVGFDPLREPAREPGRDV